MPQFDQAAVQALQRAFASHVLTLRGSLPNASPAADPNVEQLVLEGHRNDGEVTEGQLINLRDPVPTPPLAAFVGKLPMKIEAHFLEGQGYRVTLIVPAGIQLGEGAVRLQWPTRTIPAVPPLQLPKPSVYQEFDLSEKEGVVGTKVQVGKFGARPIEVEFGDHSVPEDQFGYKDGVLEATVPTDTGNFRVRVTTADGKRYLSNSGFLTYRLFDLRKTEGVVGTEVAIGHFKYPPVKVTFLEEELLLAQDAFRFNDGILFVTIPGPPDEPDAKGSKVAVETANHHQLHISNKFFFRRQRHSIEMS